MHKMNEMSIPQLENWLRENPNADWIARHDMIARLRELKEELTIKQKDNEIKSAEIQ